MKRFEIKTLATNSKAIEPIPSCASMGGPSISVQQPAVTDHCAISARAFHKLAERYRDKFMDLTLYDDSYREFCGLLRSDRARVLDAACGPGNVSRYLMTRRPDLNLLGIDLAPRMVELAREAVPSAHFAVHDCRNLPALQLRFDGIVCAFGMPYLSREEATGFIQAAGRALEPGGVLNLSMMLGEHKDSGFECCSSGDLVYLYYRSEAEIMGLLQRFGFTLLQRIQIASPSAAGKATTDLIVIAKNRDYVDLKAGPTRVTSGAGD